MPLSRRAPLLGLVCSVAVARVAVAGGPGGWTMEEIAGDTRLRLAGDLSGVVVSADGQWVAAGTAGRAIYLWRFRDGRLLRALPCAAGRPLLVAARDGRTLLADCAANSVTAFDVRSGRALRTFAAGRPFGISGDGKRLLAASADHRAATVWDLKTGKLLGAQPAALPVPPPSKVPETSAHPAAAALLPDGRRLLVLTRRMTDRQRVAMGDESAEEISYEEALELRDLGSLRVRRSHVLGSRVVSAGARDRLSVSSSSDGKHLLVAPPGGGILLWDVAGESPPRLLRAAAADEVPQLSPDGQRALFWAPSAVTMVDVTADRVLWTEGCAAGGTFVSAALSADGATVVATSSAPGHGVLVRDAKSGHAIIDDSEGGAIAAAVGTGRKLAVCGMRSCTLRDLDSGVSVAPGRDGWVTAISPAADGARFLVGRGGGELELRDVRRGAEPLVLAPVSAVPEAARFSAQGDRVFVIARVREGQIVSGRDTTLGRPVHLPEALARPVTAAAFVSPGTRLMIEEVGVPKAESRRLSVVDLASGAVASRWIVPRGSDWVPLLGGISELYLPASGAWLVPRPFDGGRVLALIDLRTSQQARTVRGFNGVAVESRPSPDGQVILTRTRDGELRLWNADTDEVEASVKGAAGASAVVAMSPDHALVAVADQDGGIRVVELASGDARLVASLAETGDTGAALSFTNTGGTLLVGTARGAVLKFVNHRPNSATIRSPIGTRN